MSAFSGLEPFVAFEWSCFTAAGTLGALACGDKETFDLQARAANTIVAALDRGEPLHCLVCRTRIDPERLGLAGWTRAVLRQPPDSPRIAVRGSGAGGQEGGGSMGAFVLCIECSLAGDFRERLLRALGAVEIREGHA